jgi:hypothetical protein
MKKSYDNDDKQFHHQQNEQPWPLKRKFKQWWSQIPSISTKQTTTSHLHSLNTKRGQRHDVGNSCPVLGQAQTCGGVKPVDRIPTPSW